jgi:hypothetical protein
VAGDPYPLDSASREVTDAGTGCTERVAVTRYTGETIRYEPAIRVAPAFAAKLAEAERIVARAAIEHYGRAPLAIVHYGAFACRPVRGRTDRLSEHALGNALDVAGFSFAPLRRDAVYYPVIPPALRRSFTASVQRHWTLRERASDIDRVHRDFLHDVVGRLRDGSSFRAIVGPGHPGHAGHVHLDYGRYRYTSIAM